MLFNNNVPLQDIIFFLKKKIGPHSFDQIFPFSLKGNLTNVKCLHSYKNTTIYSDQIREYVEKIQLNSITLYI